MYKYQISKLTLICGTYDSDVMDDADDDVENDIEEQRGNYYLFQ